MLTEPKKSFRERVDFSKIGTVFPMPDLLDIQTQSYAEFLQMELLPEERKDTGLQAAFTAAEIVSLDAAALGLDPERIGVKGSATKILNVYSPTEGKKNIVLTGAPKRIVEQLFQRFDDKIGGAIGQDLKSERK